MVYGSMHKPMLQAEGKQAHRRLELAGEDASVPGKQGLDLVIIALIDTLEEIVAGILRVTSDGFTERNHLRQRQC